MSPSTMSGLRLSRPLCGVFCFAQDSDALNWATLVRTKLRQIERNMNLGERHMVVQGHRLDHLRDYVAARRSGVLTRLQVVSDVSVINNCCIVFSDTILRGENTHGQEHI